MSAEVLWVGGSAAVIGGCLSYFGRRWTAWPRWAWWILLGISVGVAVFYSYIAIWRHEHFATHAFDLGIFDQAIWHASHFSSPASTVRGISNLLGDHFHPIIFTLVPLYWLWSSPIMLLVAQAILFSLIIPLGTILARRLGLPTLAGAVISLTAALHPAIIEAVKFDFHEIAFAPALMLLVAIFAVGKQWRWYWLATTALILTKESLAIYAGLLGLAVAMHARPWRFRRPEVRHGLVTFVVGLSAFFLITRAIIPALSDGQGYIYLNQYDRIGSTPVALATHIVRHPVSTIKLFTDTPEKKETVKYTLGSFLYLPIFAWPLWPATLLSLGERFWTTNYGLWLFQFHYQVVMTTLYLIGSLSVLAFFRRWRYTRGVAYGFALLFIGAVSIVYLRLTPFASFSNPEIAQRPLARWNDAIAAIPKKATVSAQDVFVPHLSHREAILHFPDLHDDTAYIIIDPTAESWPLRPSDIATYQRNLRDDGQWEIIFDVGTTTVFKRR